MPVTVASQRGTPVIAAAAPTASAAIVLAANPNRKVALIANNGTATVYIGPDNSVTAATGYPIPAGQAFQDSSTVGAWYGITASGTADVRTMEVS